MERHLNLIKTGHQEIEKRVFPRFPFSYLVFREAGDNAKSYEVNDISYSGMQVSLKDGDTKHGVGESITGEIHWYGQVVKVQGIIRRAHTSNLGIEFSGGQESELQMKEFLSIENISKINFQAPHFYSQDLREMAAIMHNTRVFIAADNGVMHLASAALTPCVGFFSVTNPNIYGPYGNGSVALHTDETNIDDWINAIDGIIK